MTPKRFGTSLNASAPVESTMRWPSNFAIGSSIGVEPVASTTCCACENLDAGIRRDLDAIAGEQLAAALEARDAAGLEHRLDARRQLLDDAALARLHRFDVDAEPGDMNAVRLELGMRAVIELRGLEQRFRRNAADVQARAAEEARALLVLAIVDARGRKAELRRAQRGGIAGRTAADDDDVEFLVAHCVTLIG